jgi:hypothetical protein
MILFTTWWNDVEEHYLYFHSDYHPVKLLAQRHNQNIHHLIDDNKDLHNSLIVDSWKELDHLDIGYMI